jgi:hypothetical protein
MWRPFCFSFHLIGLGIWGEGERSTGRFLGKSKEFSQVDPNWGLQVSSVFSCKNGIAEIFVFEVCPEDVNSGGGSDRKRGKSVSKRFFS